MLGHNNVFREYVPINGHFYALLLVHGSHNHTLSQCDCRRYDATFMSWGMIQSLSWTNVELDSKSPFVRHINQSHRMSDNPCKLSIRRLRCYRPVHSRAVDKLFHRHGPSSEAIAAVQKDQVTMTRDRQSANKQPFYCPRGSHCSNSVRFFTTEHFIIIITSYDVHNWLNLNRQSTNSPVTDCGDDDLSGDTHMSGGISKTVTVRAS